jgi:hypothetical protein
MIKSRNVEIGITRAYILNIYFFTLTIPNGIKNDACRDPAIIYLHYLSGGGGGGGGVHGERIESIYEKQVEIGCYGKPNSNGQRWTFFPGPCWSH